MSLEREELRTLIQLKKTQIRSIQEEIKNLEREDCLLCDDLQWYTEKDEEYFVSKRPKVIKSRRMGRINWMETFYDEDSGEGVDVKRSETVKIDGKWLI